MLIIAHASFILKTLVYWRKNEVKVSWGVCDFTNLTTWRGPFLRLMSVGVIATRVFLDWKGRALSKRGVVYGTSVYRTESVAGWQATERLLCDKLQWWTLPWDNDIFVRNFSVGLKMFCYGFIAVFYKSKQLQMLAGGPNYIMIRRAIFEKVDGHGIKEIWLISQFPAKHTGVRGQWRQNCVRSPRAGSTFGIRSWRL